MKLNRASRLPLLSMAVVLGVVAFLSQQRATPTPTVVEDAPMQRVRACQENMRQIGTAMEMYATDSSGKYPPTLEAVVPTYLPAIPSCPSAGKDTYSEGFRVGPDAPGNTRNFVDFYAVSCSGNHHQEAGLAANSPSYDAAVGALPKLPFAGTPQKALEKCEQNLKNLGTAMEMYSIDYRGGFPPSLSGLVPDYVAEIPPCPVAEVDTYSESLELGASAAHNSEKFANFYYFECSGGHHQDVTGTEAEPSFDNVRGLSVRE